MDNECCICTEDDDVIALPCAHVFHVRCIATWFKNGLTCPMCRCRFNFSSFVSTIDGPGSPGKRVLHTLVTYRVFDADELIVSARIFTREELLVLCFMDVFAIEEIIYLLTKGLICKVGVLDLVRTGYLSHQFST